MPTILTDFLEFLSSDAFGMVKIITLSYFSLLWLAIIIWITRDALSRSNSIIFQAFSILLNISVPILGVLLYLIIRPGRTRMERYYEELEVGILNEETEEQKPACGKCLLPVEKEFAFCPNCSVSLKKLCVKCKKSFSNTWNFCPFCGKEHVEKPRTIKKTIKKTTK